MNESENGEMPRITDPIDQITLDFLMNRNHYKKYVAKTDPLKHIENEEHLQKIWRYRTRISEMTDQLLENPETMVTLDISQAFDRYVRTLIRYFEMKELENSDDSDMLFDKIGDDDGYNNSIEEGKRLEIERKMALLNEADKSSGTSKSYWGKETVKKTQTMADFFLHHRKHT
jgi:hypothetical protein